MDDNEDFIDVQYLAEPQRKLPPGVWDVSSCGGVEADRLMRVVPERAQPGVARIWKVISEAWCEGRILTQREMATKAYCSRSTVTSRMNHLFYMGVIHLHTYEARGYRLRLLFPGYPKLPKEPDPPEVRHAATGEMHPAWKPQQLPQQ